MCGRYLKLTHREGRSRGLVSHHLLQRPQHVLFRKDSGDDRRCSFSEGRVDNESCHDFSLLVYKPVLADLCLRGCGEGRATSTRIATAMSLGVKSHIISVYARGAGCDKPDNDPCYAHHRRIVQVIMNRIQLHESQA